MAGKRKDTDDDIPGAGQPRPRPRAARTETTAGEDTAAGGFQPLPVRPGAPLQFGRAARGGRGGSGSGYGGLAPPLANPGGAPTAGETAARVTPATVNAVGFLDASSQFGGAARRGGDGSGSGHGGLAPPLGNPGGAGGSATGYGSVSGGQNETARPWQTGTGQPHGDSGGLFGQPPSAAPEQQSSSRARAASPVSSYRAGLEALDAGLLAADRILSRPISISPRAPGCKFCGALTTLVFAKVPFCRTCFRHHFFGGPPPQHAQIGSAPPSPVPGYSGAPRGPVALPASEQEFQGDLEALDAELLAVTRTLKNLKIGSGPICKACGRLSGSNNACGVCRQGGPPPSPPPPPLG